VATAEGSKRITGSPSQKCALVIKQLNYAVYHSYKAVRLIGFIEPLQGPEAAIERFAIAVIV